MNALRYAMVLLFLPWTAIAQRGQDPEASPALDFDRRAAMRLKAAPSRGQREAVARLRDALGGSLLHTYDPASGVTHGLFNPVGKLTGPHGGDPLDIALRFVRDHLDLLGLEPADASEIAICDVVYSAVSGATHVYLCQKHLGLPVLNAQLHVNVSADGSVLSVNNSFVPTTRRRRRLPDQRIENADARVAVASHLGVRASARRRGGSVLAEALSSAPIDPELVWVPLGRDLRLAWRFLLHTPDGRHVYDVTVDAEPGAHPHSSERVLTRFDRVSPGLYQVYALPTESPTHASVPPPDDGRDLVSNPEHPLASPLGWHDDGSTSYQTMRGNNVHAYDDRNADDAPPLVEPDCGPDLECSFAIDLTQGPETYTAAAVANLFYWTNVMHDVQYLYGFDEAAGNFQFENFGRGGLGGDLVRAEAQDGSGIDNANFTATVDGSPPKIQMYLWDFTFPLRDGDLDAGIIVHEYGHGVSTRLVGGPSTVSCLSNPQQPGEGLSDWWALVYTAKPGDAGTDPRGIGTYVLGEPANGYGIRTQPYSTSPNLNTHTYESIQGMAVPHGVGEVWAQAAWEAYWMLVAFHGFDPDLYDPMGGAGNQRMMLYVNEGLKNTACSPTFTDVRDGILQAAIDNYGGEDVCLLWEAFAAFGLGEDANSGGPFSTNPVNGFRVPAACLAGPRITSPAPHSQLTGRTVTFEWTPDQENVSEWALEIGTSLGATDVFASGPLAGASSSLTVTGLPVDGRPLYARLHFLIGTEWGFRDALYTADLATPEIVAPVPGDELASSNVTFVWDSLGLPVDAWSLDVGASPGQGNYFSSGTLAGDVTSIEASGVPTDGRPVYARLRYLFDGDWHFADAAYTAATIVPSLTAPPPGSSLTGAQVTFVWDANGGLADDWMLFVGSGPGLSDLFNSGSLGAGASSVTVSALPTDGGTLYVRLRYAFRNVWRFVDHNYQAAELTPEISAPVPGTTFTGAAVTFTWSANGAPVGNWILEVGSSAGRSELFYSGTLAADVTSVTAGGLPTDGRAIHVRLRYRIGSSWLALSYEYTAAELVPELASPVPGSVLPGSEASFAWSSNGAPVKNWTLGVGSQPGLSNLFYSGTLAADVLSTIVTGLPVDSSTVHVRLRYLTGSVWSTLDYVFSAAAPPPVLTQPPPGARLADTTETFVWSDSGTAVDAWRLLVGSAPGEADLYDSGPLGAATRSVTVSNLPTDGRRLYVRLVYEVSGVVSWSDFLYDATLREPALTSPTPGSVLPGAEASFAWATNGADVSEWSLLVGSTLGAGDLHDSGPLPASTLARSVSGLPTDGRDVFVRLGYVVSSESAFKDYLYVAGVGVPELLQPTPGSTLPGADVTFAWTANSAPVTRWLLYVGTSPGSSNLFYSGSLDASTTSVPVSALPTDGRTLHVRLRYLLDGVWQSRDEQYTAARLVPSLTSPAEGTVLESSEATFTWSANGASVTSWRLYVGPSPGSSAYFYSGTLAAGVLAAEVTGLPTDSRTLYVRLNYLMNGAWSYRDYPMTAAHLVPEIVSPAPDTELPGADVTFVWTSNGASVSRWILDVGTSPGLSNVYYSGSLTSDVQSAAVTGVPTNGAPIYVRLRYLAHGVWKSSSYAYTAASPSP